MVFSEYGINGESNMTEKLPIGPTLGTVTVRARVLDFVAGNFSIVSLAILIVVSTMMSPHFLTTENVFNVLRQWTMVACWLSA